MVKENLNDFLSRPKVLSVDHFVNKNDYSVLGLVVGFFLI